MVGFGWFLSWLIGWLDVFLVIGLELIAPRKLWLESEYFGANKPNNSLNIAFFFFKFLCAIEIILLEVLYLSGLLVVSKPLYSFFFLSLLFLFRRTFCPVFAFLTLWET